MYGIQCIDYNSFYVGKTIITIYNSIQRTYIDLKKSTAVTKHFVRNNHDIIFDDVKVFGRGKLIGNYLETIGTIGEFNCQKT